MRNPRACRSLAQHSGDFVFLLVFGLLMSMPTSLLQTAKRVSGTTTETQHMTVQTIPKAHDATRRRPCGKIQCQRAMARTCDILSKF
jgi:hypothetical protein